MLPTKDSATSRGIKTAVQAIIGLIVGLLVTVWAVPGVPHVVINYIQSNFIQVLLSVGIPSGLASWIWNAFRADLPKY